MEFTIQQSDFRKAVNSVLPAIAGSIQVLPAYTCIQMEVLKDGVAFTATDGIVTLKRIAPAVTKTPGCVGVSGKALSDILALLPSGDVRVHMADTNRLQIRAARSALHLNAMAGDQFPKTPEYEKFEYSDINGLFTSTDAVGFAASKSADKPALMGVFLRPSEVVGLDGHRMAIRKVNFAFKRDMIVPAESLNRVRKVFSDEKLGISVADSEIHLHQGAQMATLRLLTGMYPDYTRVIPTEAFTPAKIKRTELHEALKIISVVADKQNTAVFDFKNSSLTLSAETPELGRAEHGFEVEFEGEQKIAVSAKYMKDTVERLQGDVILFELRGALKPMVIRDGEDMHVIMPKRLG